MKDINTIARQIRKICPFDWAKDLEVIKISIPSWIKEGMWDKYLGGSTGGFIFKRTKKGKRYLELEPIRIYID
jgi:hypothetical protein